MVLVLIFGGICVLYFLPLGYCVLIMFVTLWFVVYVMFSITWRFAFRSSGVIVSIVVFSILWSGRWFSVLV